MAKLLSLHRSLLGSLLILGVVLPVLLMSSLTATQATPASTRVLTKLNNPVISTVAGVELSSGYEQIVTPASIITYTHTLTNTGTNADTFTLDVSSSQGWPVSLLGETETLSLPLQLDAGLTTTFLISLSVPTSVISGTVDMVVIRATSQTSPTVSISVTDTTTVNNGTWLVYLPLVLKRWPPLPDTPVFNSISNPSNVGDYYVTWNPAYLADSYIVEEDDNVAFASPTAQPVSSGTYWLVTGRPSGTYYYRVKAVNTWGASGWSNIQSTTVNLTPGVPTLSPISNPYEEGFYSVTWSGTRLATSYILEEDDNAAFSSPTIQYNGNKTSLSITDHPGGTFYYRVKATNAWSESGWSNVQSTTALPGLHGRVTYHGSPVGGVTIAIQLYDGWSWSTIRTMKTQADGTYQFLNLPIPNGQEYRSLYSNSASANFVAGCESRVYYYVADASLTLGNFEIANIPQVSPPKGATIALPYTFQWTKRSGVSDTYIIEIWGANEGWVNLVGSVDQYTLNTLPSSLHPGTQYTWDVSTAVVDRGGLCYSFDQNRTVKFSGGAETSHEGTVVRPYSRHKGDFRP